ncbi:MAG: DUF1573 domain-containing protein [Flavobacteriales bacterium]
MDFKSVLTTTAFAAALLITGCAEAEKKSEVTARPAGKSEKSVNAEIGQQNNLDPARQQASEPAGPITTMEFAEYDHDFGTLDEGDVVTHVFTFTNTGDEPLLLGNCKGSCGCTVPQCPKEPIAPGETGEIEVKFNSKSKKNNQTKRVTIDANTDPAQTILTIRAFVNPANT